MVRKLTPDSIPFFLTSFLWNFTIQSSCKQLKLFGCYSYCRHSPQKASGSSTGEACPGPRSGSRNPECFRQDTDPGCRSKIPYLAGIESGMTEELRALRFGNSPSHNRGQHISLSRALIALQKISDLTRYFIHPMFIFNEELRPARQGVS